MLALDFTYEDVNYIVIDEAAKTCMTTTSKSFTGDVKIPETAFYEGVEYKVVEIGESSFINKKSLTSVEIPNTVIKIGEYAFYNCTSLKSIDIPNSVKSIGNRAFNNCSSLESIIIPELVGRIEDATFNNCVSLKSVVIPNSVITIGERAFDGCGFLTLKLPNSVKSIRNSAFIRCRELKTIVLPNSLDSIADKAFRFCEALTTIDIPASVTYLAENAFDYCSNLKSINVDENNKDYCSINGIVWNKEGTNVVIVPPAYTGSFAIPDTVTSIADNAFSGYTGLTEVTIPSSVTSIGNKAFSGCTSLTSITIPSSVTSIGEGVFSGCVKLTSFNLDKDNPAYCLIDGALYNKDVTLLLYVPVASTGSFEIPATVTRIGNYAFSDCSKLTNITIPNSVTSIGSGAFQLCNSISAIVLPDSITEIADYTFDRCSSLTSISIPNSVTRIGFGVFRYCSSLASVSFPHSLTSIGQGAFFSCYSLASISLPNTLKTIEYNAFSYCTKLTSLIIPNSVTNIDGNAFYRCNNLTQIQCYVSFPPSTSQIFSQEIYDKATLYIPTGTKERYAKVNGWKEFKNVVDDLSSNGIIDMTPRSFTSIMALRDRQISWYVYINPASAAEYVECSTSDESIVKIDRVRKDIHSGSWVNVIATAKSYGMATLTAKCDNTTLSCVVSVVPYTVTLDCDSVELAVSEQKQLTASVFPQREFTYNSIPAVVWASSNTDVVEVSESGLVTAKSPGEAVITATCGDGSAYCIVNVPQPADVPEVKLSIKLALAQKLQLSAIISPENADDEVVWTSTNSEIVAVADDGTVTAKALGKAVVTATCGERSASCVFSVEESAGDITGIDDVNSEVSNEVVVYNLQGILMDVSTREELKELPAGYYIVNNQVELVK